jgi:hypothetical protein
MLYPLIVLHFLENRDNQGAGAVLDILRVSVAEPVRDVDGYLVEEVHGRLERPRDVRCVEVGATALRAHRKHSGPGGPRQWRQQPTNQTAGMCN